MKPHPSLFIPAVFLALLALTPGVSGAAPPPAPFTSDGCNSFPDGPPQEPEKWRACCVRHDRAYWLGGTYAERLQADRELQECIAAVENPLLAETMWAGVRVGGFPFWPTPFRWGYGWPYSRGYRAVSAEEERLAEALLERAE